MRSYGLSSGKLGTLLALSSVLGGLLGTWLSGEWSCRKAPQDEPKQLKAMALGIGLAGLLYLSIQLSSSLPISFILFGLATAGIYVINGPGIASIQELVPERMRAVAFAIVYLVSNLIGMGLGPLAVGIISDLLSKWVGAESLRYSLLAFAPGYFLAAWFAWQASHTIARDIAATAEA
jgi:MFS family permease